MLEATGSTIGGGGGGEIEGGMKEQKDGEGKGYNREIVYKIIFINTKI